MVSRRDMRVKETIYILNVLSFPTWFVELSASRQGAGPDHSLVFDTVATRIRESLFTTLSMFVIDTIGVAVRQGGCSVGL